jgi:CRP-like cAMP-binding protein
MTDQTIVEALRGSRLAAELSDEQLRTLASNLAFRDLQPGEVLVQEGTSDNHLYVVVKGALASPRMRGQPAA